MSIFGQHGDGHEPPINTDPGWYSDPYQPDHLRYWDGVAWSPYSRAVNATGQALSQGRKKVGRGTRVIGIVVAACVLLGCGLIWANVANRVSTSVSGRPSTQPTASTSATPKATPTSSASVKGFSEAVLNSIFRFAGVSSSLGDKMRDHLKPKTDSRTTVAGLGASLDLLSQRRDAFSEAIDSDPTVGDRLDVLLAAFTLETDAYSHLIDALKFCSDGSGGELCRAQAALDSGKALNRAIGAVIDEFERLDLPNDSNNQPKSVDSSDLEIGDCANVEPDFTIVDCTDSHEVEAYSQYKIPNVQFKEYPGEVSLTKVANRQCEKAFIGYVGRDWRESDLQISYVYPSEGSWSSGDRTIICVAGLDDQRTTGTIANSGR